MSGTALLLLAMHVTASVVSPAGRTAFVTSPAMLAALVSVAFLAVIAAYAATLHPRRRAVAQRRVVIRHRGPKG
ncbi:MAG TPA: hypothetical protein PK264_07115 [Hyphomicrobiaceae bacterium]|nr:hypothetical protein [Hyphomicrobiaceae bacterium]